MFVDDDPDTCSRFALMLEAEGYHVLTAEDAEQGVALLRTRKPAAIVTSVRLAEHSAWVLCSVARSELPVDTPVILLNERRGIDWETLARARRLRVAVLPEADARERLPAALSGLLRASGPYGP